METLRKVIKDRDNIDDAEFDSLVQEAFDALEDGEDTDDVLRDVFSVEPDFVFDLIKEVQKQWTQLRHRHSHWCSLRKL